MADREMRKLPLGNGFQRIESTVKIALEQLENKKYESELQQRGIERYKKQRLSFSR